MKIRLITACVLVTLALACGDDNPVGPSDSRRRYLLSGTVTEPVGVPVTGYTVRIEDSDNTQVFQALPGDYRAVVVEGRVTIQASKEGYHSQGLSIDVRGATDQDIEIQPVTPPAPFSGPFWMTLVADPATCGALPSALRTRRYAVDVEQAGAGIKVHLTDPRLKPGLSADGRVHGTALRVDFWSDHYYYYYFRAIEEPLDDTRTLGVSGTLEGTVTGGGANGQLTGRWEVRGSEGSPQCQGVHAARFDRR